jgi:hypothetical protein
MSMTEVWWHWLKKNFECGSEVNMSSRLLSRNLKIKVYRTIILPVVFMGVKLGR